MKGNAQVKDIFQKTERPCFSKANGNLKIHFSRFIFWILRLVIPTVFRPERARLPAHFADLAPTRRSLLRPTLTQKQRQNNRQKLSSVLREKNVALPGITMNTTISSRHSGTGAN